LFTN
jgi:5'-AMP-activated protein kinase, catalytic alpha subunit